MTLIAIRVGIKAVGKFPTTKEAFSRKPVSVMDGGVVALKLVISVVHHAQLFDLPSDRTRSVAIICEVSGTCGKLQRWTHAAAVNGDDPESKAALVVVVGVIGIVGAGLEMAEVYTYAS